MWELFENKDWKGRSAVLSEGQFYDTASLPFGDDHLSSIHKVATFDANMEQTRKDISNARGLGKRTVIRNYLKGTGYENCYKKLCYQGLSKRTVIRNYFIRNLG